MEQIIHGRRFSDPLRLFLRTYIIGVAIVLFPDVVADPKIGRELDAHSTLKGKNENSIYGLACFPFALVNRH